MVHAVPDFLEIWTGGGLGCGSAPKPCRGLPGFATVATCLVTKVSANRMLGTYQVRLNPNPSYIGYCSLLLITHVELGL